MSRLREEPPALPRSGCSAMDATTTSSGIVTAHTTMQYGHSAPMR